MLPYKQDLASLVLTGCCNNTMVYLSPKGQSLWFILIWFVVSFQHSTHHLKEEG